ncbi:MAG: fumarate hydratase [Clostridia bacterium]|nr:fumarate hydratase [Clostridia bacterium]
MRVVETKIIAETVEKLFLDANCTLPCDLEERIRSAVSCESRELAREALGVIADNLDEAKKYDIPICQDTGMAIILAEVGNEVFIDGDFEDAINEGVSKAYFDGKLRCSVVADSLFDRKNTENNTPAIIYTRIIKGDKIKLTALPKGFGSENKSRIKMFNPSAKPSDIVDFVVETVKIAGSMPCPPLVVGVGIGGSFDYAAFLSKKALSRDISLRNPDERYASLEEEMLNRINALGIGPQGFGGNTTALAVNIEEYPTHIAGLPVAVNISCHVTRHASAEI